MHQLQDMSSGAVGKTLPFSLVSGKKLLFTFAKKYCLLKEKILGLYLGGAHHRAYYYCFGGTKKECLYFLCYGAHPLSLVPEPFLLRNKVFLLNVKNSLLPEAELEKSVFTTNPLCSPCAALGSQHLIYTCRYQPITARTMCYKLIR